MQPEPGPSGPQWRPLKRADSHEAEQMVARAAELARDSHARTRHAAVLVKDGSMLGWGANGVPFPGEDHCYCKVGESGQHDQCRIHAEQRAITLAREGDGWRLLPGAKLTTRSAWTSRTSARGAAAWRCRWAWRSGSSRCPRAWSATPRPTTTRSPSSGGSGPLPAHRGHDLGDVGVEDF